MRRKIVLWGANEKDERILVALELMEKENVVDIYTFPEAIATESFYKDMTDRWKEDKEVEFPSGFKKIERKLSVSDSLLPDDIKVERPDIITRAQAEWHFVVLSSKLYGLYKSELEEFKDKIDALKAYDSKIWEELKTFWTKVQNQMNEKNLFREHGASLRERTNLLFEKMKDQKKILDKELEVRSKEFFDKVNEEILEIEEKIEKGLGLQPLFDDLRKLQDKVRSIKFTREHRNEVADKIDVAFKKIKAKRNSGEQLVQQTNRLESRYNGLLAAIQKMEKSIQLDQRDFDFQSKKIEDSDGQLESQLRQAKIRMIQERISSKSEKLDDMYKTKSELESKLEKEKKRFQKLEKQEKVDEAKEAIKKKIANTINEAREEMDKMSDKLSKAAAEIGSKKSVKQVKDKIQDGLIAGEHIIEDVVDAVKAAAEVAEEKAEDLSQKAKTKYDQAADSIKKTADNIEQNAEEIKEAAENFVDNLLVNIKAAAELAEEKIEELIESSEKKKTERQEDEEAKS